MTECTDDGRYVVVAGRRWRATDPMIPPERAAELRRALMAWRREVKAVRGTEAEWSARGGVQAVKVALGERGCPWWEQTATERKRRWEMAVPLPDRSWRDNWRRKPGSADRAAGHGIDGEDS